MPTPTETMPLEMAVELDWKRAQAGVKQWETGWKRSQKLIEKASQRSMKGAGKAVGDFYHKWRGGQKQGISDLQALTKRQHELSAAYLETQREVVNLGKAQKEISAKGGKADAAALARIVEKKKQAEALTKVQIDALTKVRAEKAGVTEKIKDLEIDFDTEEFVKAAEDAGRALISPLTALRSKDLPGFLGALSKGGMKMGSLAGDALLERAAKMKEGGAISKAGGAGIEKMVGMFSKLAPLIGIVSSLTVAFVKLLIDAEATVKEINKEVLATASTGQYLTRSFGNAGTAAEMLKGTLKDISDAALSLNNIGWGITKETHTAVISALTAEGVSLRTLEQQYGALNAQTNEYSKSFGSITEMAVTYSRLMGVSLQEIATLQGEMMTEMGKSVLDVQRDFSMMRQEADAAGISENKFFAMIRGVSADLSLYNTRIEDAVHLLGALGKVMSPRNAQQFMSTAMNAYKGMSFQEKVQHSLLAGPEKVAKIVAADIASKNESLAKSIAEAGGGTAKEIADKTAELQSALKSGNDQAVKGAIDALEKTPGKAQQGTLRGALSMLDLEKKRSKGGLVGNAAALGQVNAVGAVEARYAAATHFGKPGEGIGGEAGPGVAGMSADEVQSMVQMADQVKDLRAALMAKADKDGKKKWEQATWQEILATDVDGQKSAEEAAKKAAEDAAKEAEFAQKQGENINTVTDKIGVLVDWALGKFYGLFKGLYDMLAQSPVFGGDAAKRQMQLIRAVEDSKDKDTSSALSAAGGDAWKFRGELMKSDGMKRVLSEMNTGGQAGQVAKQDFLGAASADEMRDTIQKDLGQGFQDRLVKAYEAAQKNDPSLETVSSYGVMTDTSKMQAALGQMSEEDQQKFVEKLGHWMDPAKLAKLLPELKATTGTAGTPPVTPAPPTSTQPTTPPLGTTKPVEGAAPKAPLAPSPPAGPPAAGPPPAGPPPPPPAQQVAAFDATVKSAVQLSSQTAALEQMGISSETANELLDTQKGTLDNIYHALRQRGIKVEKFGNDKAKDAVHDAVLDAAREALVEYYLLQQTPEADVMKAIQGGMGSKDVMTKIHKQTQNTGKPGLNAPEPLTATATGGIVTGVTDGLAQVRAAAGEGLASVGRGETIVPAGGGGGGGTTARVTVEFRGDAKRMMQVVASDTYATNRSRERRGS